jgi:hypothetical protein
MPLPICLNGLYGPFLSILRFRASNQPPYAFEWLDLKATSLDYGAILTRISREYN